MDGGLRTKIAKNGKKRVRSQDEVPIWARGPRTSLAYFDDVSGRVPTFYGTVRGRTRCIYMEVRGRKRRKSEKTTEMGLKMPTTGWKPLEIARGPSPSHHRPFPAENFMYSRQCGPRTNFAGIGVCPRTDTATFRVGLRTDTAAFRVCYRTNTATFRAGLRTEIDPEQNKGPRNWSFLT